MPNTSLKEKYGLTYQIDYAFLAKSTVGFEGKDVLEVGGSLPSDFVKHDLGARRWTALEEMSYWTETLSTGYVLGVPPDSKKLGCKIADATSLNIINDYNNIYGNIEDIPETLNSSFDAVFSIAAFEHIARLPQALTAMNKALRVGGKLFSLFAPIWSCYNGHHLPEIVDSEGNHWNFGNSPIPAWGHLLMSRTEMLSFLYKKNGCFYRAGNRLLYLQFTAYKSVFP